jgi:hypothetical protein
MKMSSNKYIFQMDYTLCDLLVRDALVDRARVADQAAQGLGRPQHIFSVDPFTRLIMACWLSYEEKAEIESEH